MMLDDREMIEVGTKAKALLAEEFYELFELVQREISEQMMATPLGATADRELLYNTFHGMRAFRDRLQSYALAADSIVAAREENTHDDQLGYASDYE